MNLTPDQTLSHLSVTRAGASRVFQRHGLDFCCHGQISLREACAKESLDAEALIAEILAEERAAESFERWDEQPPGALIEHLLTRFHEPHRAELPRLHAMARKVEEVHGEKATCPRGLAAHLGKMEEELELHMQKEEEVLFPLILSGRGRMASMPVHVMEQEHRDHGQNLVRLRELAHDFAAPAEACGTWRALYLGLVELESELMQHIHLENNILFPRALRS
ncbi:MAG: iron-sulfur cluster repair di-iron protein [Deltaproteobacteria bacterium]|nr:iron-sulfur cluster repair di-iron protein [Deltaproteobacteria bacterium]